MFDVVGIGANSVDRVYRLAEYPKPDSPSAKQHIRSHVVSCGGQTATTLCTCTSLGLRTRYIGTVGGDEAGRLVRRELAARGVNIEGVVTRETPNPYAVILLDERLGERIVLWDRSPDSALAPDEVPAEAIRQARLLHVDDVDPVAAIGAAGLARAAGIPVTSDIDQITPHTTALMSAVTVPIFAEHVPPALTGLSDPGAALRRLREQHPGMLCVTLGTRGAMLLVDDTLHHAPAYRVPVSDTTGSGDVFRGAFITGLLRGDTPQMLLRYANAAAAASCTRTGAFGGVPSRDEIAAIMASGATY